MGLSLARGIETSEPGFHVSGIGRLSAYCELLPDRGETWNLPEKCWLDGKRDALCERAEGLSKNIHAEDDRQRKLCCASATRDSISSRTACSVPPVLAWEGWPREGKWRYDPE
jgi:hypothetical protein